MAEEPEMSRPLHDPYTVGQALDVAIANPKLIPRVIAMTGTTLEEAGFQQYAEIAVQLGEIHRRGIPSVDINVLCAMLAEHSPQYQDRDAWKPVVAKIIGTGYDQHLDAYEDRLLSLRWRRRLVRLGEHAQNGHEDTALNLEIHTLASGSIGTRVGPLHGLDLAAEPPPVPEPIVGNEKAQLIMPGEATLIASDPGVGKTKLLTAIALGIAAGREIIGLACVRRPVVYVTSDGDPGFLRNIHRQWDGTNAGDAKLADLPLFIESDDDFNLEDDSCFASLRSTLEKQGFKEKAGLFIIETIATNVVTTDLNDQKSVRQYVRARIRSLMKEFPGLIVITSAHLRKTQEGGKSDLGNRVAGSMQLRGAFDSAIGLVPDGKDAFSVRRIKRSRSGGQFEPFRIQIEGGLAEPLVLRNTGTVEVSIEEARGAAKYVMDFMLKAGTKRPLTAIVAGITAMPGAPRQRAIQEAAKKLAEGNDPFLVRVGKKPAVYDLVKKAEQSDLGGLE
jgi:hypothetical protein